MSYHSWQSSPVPVINIEQIHPFFFEELGGAPSCHYGMGVIDAGDAVSMQGLWEGGTHGKAGVSLRVLFGTADCG